MSEYQNESATPRWMWSTLWIVVIAVVYGVGYNFFRGKLFDNELSLNMKTYDIENVELGPKSKVIVTMNDNTYHLRGCGAIIGTTEKIIYNAALSKAVAPCSICIKDGY